VSTITLPRAVVEFLLGEGPLDGVWYGDEHPTNPRPYWWRKHIRAALAEPEKERAEVAAPARNGVASSMEEIDILTPESYRTTEPPAKPEPVAVDLAKEGSDKTVISFVTLPSPATREPATDEQIVKAGGECAVVDNEYLLDFRDGFRAAELFHGITKEDKL